MAVPPALPPAGAGCGSARAVGGGLTEADCSRRQADQSVAHRPRPGLGPAADILSLLVQRKDAKKAPGRPNIHVGVGDREAMRSTSGFVRRHSQSLARQRHLPRRRHAHAGALGHPGRRGPAGRRGCFAAVAERAKAASHRLCCRWHLSSKALREPPDRCQHRTRRCRMTGSHMGVQVLSLLTFFAPAKKVGRPPGRNPGRGRWGKANPRQHAAQILNSRPLP